MDLQLEASNVELELEELDFLRMQTDIARALAEEGRLAESLAVYQSVVDTLEQTSYSKHYDTLSVKFRMALVLKHMGNVEGFIQTMEEIYIATIDSLGPKAFETDEIRTYIDTIRKIRDVQTIVPSIIVSVDDHSVVV